MRCSFRAAGRSSSAQHPARRRHGLVVQLVKSFGWRGLQTSEIAAGAKHPVVTLLFVLCCAAIAYIALHRTPAARGAADFLDGVLLLVNKVWSPQFSLWLVPLAVLALPHRRIFAGVDDDRRVGVGAADVLPMQQPRPLAARAVVHRDGVAA